MRFPAYILLPIIGAVALLLALLGSWLWPAPTAPSPSLAPPVLPAPVAMEPPSPALTPPAPKSMAPPLPARPIQPAEPPPNAVAMPVEPAGVTPPPPPEPPPGPTTSPLVTDWSPEKQAEVRKAWQSLREREAEMLMAGVKELGRQREEARARGDQAEVERLDRIIRTNQERWERMRGNRQATDPAQDGSPLEVQTAPPMQ